MADSNELGSDASFNCRMSSGSICALFRFVVKSISWYLCYASRLLAATQYFEGNRGIWQSMSGANPAHLGS